MINEDYFKAIDFRNKETAVNRCRANLMGVVANNLSRIFLGQYAGEFIRNYYAAMRAVDDIADGDAPLPEGFGSGAQYIDQKIASVTGHFEPTDEIDHLLARCFAIGREIKQDFCEETIDILSSLRFDAIRREQFQKLRTFMVYAKSELSYNFNLLDTRGTVKACLKLYGEDPGRYTQLSPLSTASRIYYDLRDFSEDIYSGMCNIDYEETKDYRISKDDLALAVSLAYEKRQKIRALQRTKGHVNRLITRMRPRGNTETIDREFISSLPKSIQKWYLEKAQEGLSLLESHRDSMYRKPFGFKARLTFPLLFEIPARAYFRKVQDYVLG